MPGKCKFQDSWLAKEIYKDWLVKDKQDIHFARCKACCKSIKLQTMGEAALTSHAGGSGHKAAVRKMVEVCTFSVKEEVQTVHGPGGWALPRSGWPSFEPGLHGPSPNLGEDPRQSPMQFLSLDKVQTGKQKGGSLMAISAAGQTNGSVNPADDSKEQVAICLPRDTLDRITGGDWSDILHSPTTNPTSHKSELQDETFPTPYFTTPGSSRLLQRLHPSGGGGGCDAEAVAGCHSVQRDPADLSRLEIQQRTEAMEQQQQMKILEWENRMKVLAWEQELVREKKKAARQKEKAFRMRKAYYKAKLKRLGEDVPPSSSSSSDDEDRRRDQTG